jgi:hypothetical protein
MLALGLYWPGIFEGVAVKVHFGFASKSSNYLGWFALC